MLGDSIQLTIENNVATLTLNRPDVRNAFDDHMIGLLNQHLYELQRRDDILILILRGAGDHFSAGANIQWMQKSIKATREENHRDALNLAKLLYGLYHFPKPTIALIKGKAYGGALGLIASCDIAIAEESAEFCFSEVKLGLIPAVVSPYIVKAIGERMSRRYMLTAEVFNAEIAKKIGLVHEVVNLQQLKVKLDYFVQCFLQNGPRALTATKQLLHTLDETHNAISKMEYTAELIADLRVTEEAQEGLTAFLEKRDPRWKKTHLG